MRLSVCFDRMCGLEAIRGLQSLSLLSFGKLSDTGLAAVAGLVSLSRIDIRGCQQVRLESALWAAGIFSHDELRNAVPH
jgi:hypothetical protein